MISIIKNSKVQFEFGSRDVLGACGRPTRVCYCSRAVKGLRPRSYGLPFIFQGIMLNLCYLKDAYAYVAYDCEVSKYKCNDILRSTGYIT